MTYADPQGQKILVGRAPQINSLSTHGYRRARWPGFRPCGRLGRAFLDRLCLSVPEGTCMDLGSDGAGEKTEIRSDVRQNLRPLKKPDPVSGPKADGRQPFNALKEYLTIPVFESSVRFCLLRRETAAFRRARFHAPFIKRYDHHSKSPFLCKAIDPIAIIWLIRKDAAGACRAGGRGLPLNRTLGPAKYNRRPFRRDHYDRSNFGCGENTRDVLRPNRTKRSNITA